MFNFPSFESIRSIVIPSKTYTREFTRVELKHGNRPSTYEYCEVEHSAIYARANAAGEVCTTLFILAGEIGVMAVALALGLRLFHALPF